MLFGIQDQSGIMGCLVEVVTMRQNNSGTKKLVTISTVLDILVVMVNLVCATDRIQEVGLRMENLGADVLEAVGKGGLQHRLM